MGTGNADGILISLVLPHDLKASEIIGKATSSVTKIHLFFLYFLIKENDYNWPTRNPWYILYQEIRRKSRLFSRHIANV